LKAELVAEGIVLSEENARLEISEYIENYTNVM